MLSALPSLRAEQLQLYLESSQAWKEEKIQRKKSHATRKEHFLNLADKLPQIKFV